MQDIEMGPCAITAGASAVGATLGPVTLRVEPVWRPRREARYGQTVVDQVLLGVRVSAAAVLAEKTLANLQLAMPHAADGGDSLGIGSLPGLTLSSVAQAITLHPLEREDATRDITLHKAACAAPVALPFEEGKERAFRVEFTALLDPTREEGELLARIGGE